MGAPPVEAPAPQFPSLDPAMMAQIMAQVLAEVMGRDAEQVQALIAQQMQQFQMAQQQTAAMMPDAIAAIVAQLGAPPPETLDEAGGMVESGDMSQPAQTGPSDEELMMMMQQGALA
jgi:hypothetical protein